MGYFESPRDTVDIYRYVATFLCAFASEYHGLMVDCLVCFNFCRRLVFPTGFSKIQKDLKKKMENYCFDRINILGIFFDVSFVACFRPCIVRNRKTNGYDDADSCYQHPIRSPTGFMAGRRADCLLLLRLLDIRWCRNYVRGSPIY